MLCGVDEVGRGALAGPVVAAAAVLTAPAPPGLRDSKKLSPRQRESLFSVLQACCVWAVGQASVEEIDRLNILQATHLAMRRALGNLPPLSLSQVVIDGDRAPALEFLPPAVEVRTLVKADDLVAEVSAASVLAKVTRDALLRQLEQAHPGYGFAAHAGYGTAQHLKALSRMGPCEAHRRTFAPVKAATAKTSPCIPLAPALKR